MEKSLEIQMCDRAVISKVSYNNNCKIQGAAEEQIGEKPRGGCEGLLMF